MRRLTMIATVATAAAVLATTVLAQDAFASPKIPGHTKRQAELNVLHAVGVFRRWRVPFLDRQTNTIRSNTTVTCAGQGHGSRPGHFTWFICTIRYQGAHVRLRYVAFSGNGFGVKRLPLRR
jgi:hypothetical protein